VRRSTWASTHHRKHTGTFPCPVVYDVVVEQAERVVVQSTLELTDGPLGYIPLAANSTRGFTIIQPIKDGQSFEPRQSFVTGTPWPHFTKFFQFLRYWWFFLSWGDSAPGCS